MYPYYNKKVRLHDLGDRDYYIFGNRGKGGRIPLSPEAIEVYKKNGVKIEPAEQAHDVDRIQKLYGKRNVSTYIIDLFRRRVFRRYG